MPQFALLFCSCPIEGLLSLEPLAKGIEFIAGRLAVVAGMELPGMVVAYGLGWTAEEDVGGWLLFGCPPGALTAAAEAAAAAAF